MMTKQSETIGGAIVELYQDWDALDRPLSPVERGSEFPIVDMYLTEGPIESPLKFDNLIKIRERAEELYDEVDPRHPQAEQLKQKLGGSIMYLRLRGGEMVDPREQVKAMAGVEPMLAPETEIETARVQLEATLREVGLGHTRADYRAFRKEYEITDKTKMKEVFSRQQHLGRQVLEAFGVTSSAEIDVNFVNVKAAWEGYIMYDPVTGKFILNVNTNPSEYPPTEGSISLLTNHEETGHAVQLSKMGDNIAAGTLDPAFGIITAHTPDATQIEALPQLAPHLMLPQGNWPQRFQADYDIYRSMVWNNAYYAAIMNPDVDMKKLVAETAVLLPFESKRHIEYVLTDYRDDLVKRGYMMGYHPIFRAVRPLLSASDATRQRVIPQLYERPTTPDQITALITP